MKRLLRVVSILGVLVGVAYAAEYADFDEDGIVGFNDFVQFAQRYGSAAGDGVYESRYDVNGDGRINFGDYALFAEVFGQPIHADKVPVPINEIEDQAKAARDSGDYDKAIEKYQYFIDHARTPQDKARGLWELGSTYTAAGKSEDAKESYLKVLKDYRNSDIPAVKHQVVWSSIKLGELQETETALVLYLEYAKSLATIPE